MIEVEVLGAELVRQDDAVERSPGGASMPPPQEVRRLCALAAGAAGVARRARRDRVRRRAAHRRAERALPRRDAEPTDVLSFPIDGDGLRSGGARELGDVVICLEHTADVREAIVHGVLHLLGMDHETDDGEMLALQRELLARGRGLTRSGFVALAGRPNVGKSTLVNAVVGDKVAIVSDRPQTTRRAIRGVRSHGDCQIVLVDLPGVQRPRDALTTRMAGRVQQELADADVALLVLNGEQGVGPGRPLHRRDARRAPLSR